MDDQVTAELQAFNDSQATYTAVSTADLTTSVEQDIQSLQSNVIAGAVVVTIVSALLISWRVSILTAFFIDAVFGCTLFTQDSVVGHQRDERNRQEE